ncbi:hypothetical protein HDU76_008611 [Blyttiomyces sp. JEL0837]|nr:hypothetical protein HDU76_008611 [Blyttiomyces sp. JEL0837]
MSLSAIHIYTVDGAAPINFLSSFLLYFQTACTTVLSIVNREILQRRIFILQHYLLVNKGVDLTFSSLDDLIQLRQTYLSKASLRTRQRQSSIMKKTGGPYPQKLFSPTTKTDELPSYNKSNASAKSLNMPSILTALLNPSPSRVTPEPPVIEKSDNFIKQYDAPFSSTYEEEILESLETLEGQHEDPPKYNLWGNFVRFLTEIEKKVYVFPDPTLENACSNWQHSYFINSARLGAVTLALTSIFHAIIDVITGLCAYMDYTGKDTTASIIQCYIMNGMFQFRIVVPCKLSQALVILIVESFAVISIFALSRDNIE